MLVGIPGWLAVAKRYALDQLAQAIGAVEPAPVTLGRVGEIETHKGHEAFVVSDNHPAR